MNESMLLALPVVELLHGWGSLPVLYEAAVIVVILRSLLFSVAGIPGAPGSSLARA